MDDFTEFYINKGVFVYPCHLCDDGYVVLAIATGDAFAVDAFDEHALASALHHLEVFRFVFQRNLTHHLAAFRFHFFRNLVGHDGSLSACAHRVFEGVDVAEANLFCKVAAFLKGCFSFAREAHDDVGGEVEVGTRGLDALAHVAELRHGVKPMHAFQGVVGAALQADVHVGGELLVLEKCKKSVAELVGLDGGDPDSEVAVNIKDILHELFEVGAFVLVASHVDSSQHDFLEAVGDDLAYVVIDVLGRAARGASSHHRDDAVGAEVVAAIMDLDEAARMEGVEGRLVAEQVAVVTLRVAVASAEMLVDDVEQGGLALVVDDKVGDARLQ